MSLSRNFTLEELIRSDLAVRHGLSNNPSNEVKSKLKILTLELLQPIRDLVGPIYVNSGYRSAEVNAIVGGREDSQHCQGEAADIEAGFISNYELAKVIKESFEFDQLILEGYKLGKPTSGWVHVSYRKGKNRNQALTAFVGKDGRMVYEKGLKLE